MQTLHDLESIWIIDKRIDALSAKKGRLQESVILIEKAQKNFFDKRFKVFQKIRKSAEIAQEFLDATRKFESIYEKVLQPYALEIKEIRKQLDFLKKYRKKWTSSRKKDADTVTPTQNWKGELQTNSHRLFRDAPRYNTVKATIDDRFCYVSTVKIDKFCFQSTGSSKKKAEQAAAHKACLKLFPNGVTDSKQDQEKNRLMENRKYVQEYKSDKSCADCGLPHGRKLTFDHLDAGDKNFNIGDPKILRRCSLMVLKREIRKCELVCRPCHDAREFLRGRFYTAKKAPKNVLLNVRMHIRNQE